MAKSTVTVLHIDIVENRFGYRTSVYREGTKVLWRRLTPPGVIDLPRIDMSKYKKKVYTLKLSNGDVHKRVMLSL